MFYCFNWLKRGERFLPLILLFGLFNPFLIFLFGKKGEKNLFDLILLWTLCWWLTKRGRSIWVYMHVLCFHCLRGRSICFPYYLCIYVLVLQIGEKDFDLCLLHVLSPYLHTCLWASLHTFIIYVYAWVKGELLWSFTLIHAYITSWVLSSSKKGRLLAQRPITLVLMMINSWSYVY